MFTLTSEIKIEPKDGPAFTFGGANSVEIWRSVYSIAATAVVKVPVSAVLRQKDGSRTTTDTAREVAVGDRITIRLGYNGRLNTEFVGYVSRLNLRTPLEIECEDAYFPLRSTKVKMSGTMTLTDILSQCGLTVGYAETLTVSNFAVNNLPVTWVLGKLKTDYGLSIYFDLAGRVYACRTGSLVSEIVKYELRRNVINEDKLQYNRAQDTRLKIKAVCYQKDGTKVEAEIGEAEGSERTLYFYDVANMAELKALAQMELNRYSYDGYRGTIETFLEPRVEPTYVASITDRQYAERDGNYFVESVTTRFGASGGRRTVEIGVRI